MYWGTMAVYLALAIATARTLMPWCDEAWFSGPALQLLRLGSMGTPVLDPTAVWHDRVLTGIGQYTYWITPLYPFSQFLWFHVAPFGLLSVRMYSVLWGMVALAAWFALVRKLSGDQGLALLAMALVAVDSAFLRSAGAGRMDMMCAALGVTALAAYALLRERHLTAAIVVSQAAIAAAALVHPLAIGWCAALAVLTLYFDARRLRWRHGLYAAAAYVPAAVGWGVYISRNPALWWAQFAGNVSHRLPEGSLLAWLHKETVDRFGRFYGLGPDSHGLAHGQVLVMAVYALGAIGVLATPSIRKHKWLRGLVLVWLTMALVITILDQDVQDYYMLHISMNLAVLLAVGIWTAWQRGAMPRWALAGVVATFVAVQLATTVAHIRRDEYHKDYLAAVDYLKQKLRPGDVVFGSAELAFELGFDGTVVDDYRLGYRSGRRATYIVLDRQRYDEWIPRLKRSEPDAYQYIRGMLDHDYSLVASNEEYQVYSREEYAASAQVR